MMLNKKGTEKLLSVYWFLILIIIAGGIFGMVYVFYGYPYDFRDVEARTLTNQVADCIAEGGELKIDVSNFDLLRDCGLNFKDSTYEEIQYYVNVEILDLSKNAIRQFEAGNKNFVSSCEIANEDYGKLARCSERSFYTTSEGIGIKIKILSVVRKTEKNGRNN